MSQFILTERCVSQGAMNESSALEAQVRALRARLLELEDDREEAVVKVQVTLKK